MNITDEQSGHGPKQGIQANQRRREHCYTTFFLFSMLLWRRRRWMMPLFVVCVLVLMLPRRRWNVRQVEPLEYNSVYGPHWGYSFRKPSSPSGTDVAAGLLPDPRGKKDVWGKPVSSPFWAFHINKSHGIPAMGTHLWMQPNDYKQMPFDRFYLTGVRYEKVPYFNLSSSSKIPKKPMSIQEKLDTFREMFRAWSSWADDHQVPYWLSENTLVGWWWGRKHLPWEDHFEIQASVKIIPFLTNFNQSLIQNRYLLDVNRFVTFRMGDVLNEIDAKFIDTETGLSIDIRTVSQISWQPDWVIDKRFHRTRVKKLACFRRAEFEGILTWIPVNTESLITAQYGDHIISSSVFKDFYFSKVENAWNFMDCDGLHEIYVHGSGWLTHQHILVYWDKNATHCNVTLVKFTTKPKKRVVTSIIRTIS
jgi:hypothetical protein